MRKVKYFKYVKVEGKAWSVKVDAGEAKFHQFGCDYDEFESGAGNYSTAILELDSGEVKTVSADMIQFID